MKHYKAWVQFIDDTGQQRQYAKVVEAENEYQAINKYHEIYGPNCLIGWIKEVEVYGIQR